MKSIITAVNLTTSDITIGGVLLPALVVDPEPTPTPVVIFRRSVIFGNSAELGKLLGHVVANEVALYDFDGEQLTSQDAQVAVNYLAGQYHRDKDLPSYSDGYQWRIDSCHSLLDGLRRQLDAFDFAGSLVTVDRRGVVEKAHDVLYLLGLGYLSDALEELQATTPDTDNDFLSAARLAQFEALFVSAST